MNSFFLLATGKQCLPLLTSDGQLQGWFVPLALIVFVGGIVRYLRAVGNARSRAAANFGTVLGVLVGCVVLVGGGWLMFQFFDPTC